jgi:hypothetical protein
LSAQNSNSHLAVKKRIEQGLGDNPTLRVMQLWYLACSAYPSSPCTGSAGPGWQILDDNSWTTEIAGSPGSGNANRRRPTLIWQETFLICRFNSLIRHN